jgi:two-component system cell cycle sensor histidine kinase/response regulator CckA
MLPVILSLDSLQQQSTILDLPADSIFIHDFEGNIVFANKAACESRGYSKEEMSGMKLSKVLVSEQADLFAARVEELLKKGEIFFESAHRRKDGTVFPTETHVTTVEIQGKRYCCSAVRDISERKRAEQALQLSQERYRRIVDTANEGIWVLDDNDRTTFVNAQLAGMLGYTPEEMIGRELQSFMSDGDLTDYVQKMEKRRLGIAEHFERRWRRKDGQIVQTIVSATPIFDDENHFQGSFAMVLDITERKKLEEQLRQVQKIEAIGLLAGGVAHDFNNILTAIIGYTHLSLMKLPLKDPVRLNLEQILEASNRAAVLTQSLLAFSRRQPISLEVIDLNFVIKEFEKFIHRLIREDISFETICAEEILPAMADRGQIEHVIMNLVTNARDAMPHGGKVTIETGQIDIDQRFIDAQGFGTPGQYAFVSVSDTGTGMDEQTSLRMFEPFFTTKEQGKGTGLGLSMVYGTIKQHKGFISVRSEPGKGTNVKIYLPHAGSATSANDANEPPPVARGGTETILIAEDDEAIRKLSMTILRESGYTVIEAVNGADAVSKFKENRDIKLVILDGIMPVMNGMEAFRQIKDISPDIRCIFMSGYSEDIINRDGISKEEAGFLNKPVSPANLLLKIRETLDK